MTALPVEQAFGEGASARPSKVYLVAPVPLGPKIGYSSAFEKSRRNRLGTLAARAWIKRLLEMAPFDPFRIAGAWIKTACSSDMPARGSKTQ